MKMDDIDDNDDDNDDVEKRWESVFIMNENERE